MSLKNAIGGIALIASTAIGAAILALPVATAQLGFVSTTALFLLCWAFMTLGALYVLEANLSVGYGTNLISMAEKTLGPLGKYSTWGIYLSLLYALSAAHLAGASVWLQKGATYFHLPLTPFHGALFTTFWIAGIILLGTHIVDWINRFLVIGLISVFATLVFETAAHTQTHLLFSQSTLFDFRPIPLIVTAFGSAIVIPTLTEYLKGNGKQLVKIVLIGSLIPLLVYITWEFAIVGVIPISGHPGLLEMQHHDLPTVSIPLALEHLLNNPWITKASSLFSIFALTASFLGLGLSLFDFLADGLQIQKSVKGKCILALIAFIPPLGIILCYPHGFTVILSFAGIFVALLLGILPVLMVWQARYRLHLKSPLSIVGGKALLMLTLLFFITVIGIESLNQWELFKQP